MTPPKIMIVDDELVSRALLNKLFSLYGECQTFEGAKEALRAFHLAHEANEPYDLISLDISMPEMDGNEMLEKIRGWEVGIGIANREREVKILMVTAKSDIKSRMNSLKHGCEDYLVKPINGQSLAAALAKFNIFQKG